MRIYKLLSFFGVVRPPKKGNCTTKSADKTNSPRLIGIADLKSAVGNSTKEEQALAIRSKLNVIVTDEDWTTIDNQPEMKGLTESYPEFYTYYMTGILKKFILQ